MFSEEGLEPIVSGPTILDLNVARTKTGLSFAKDWSADALARLCKAYGINTGSIDDREMLLAMLNKSLTQPVVYDGFDLQDLTNFINARGLISRQTSGDGDGNMATPSSQRIPLQQSRWQDKAMIDDVSSPSSKRALQGTVLTEEPSFDTTHVNSSYTFDTLDTGSRDSNSVSSLKDELSVSALGVSSESHQFKSSLVELLERADRDSSFNFLDLPAEIRQQVYKFTCLASLTILHPQQQPAIAKACHLTRAEALPLYYRHNRFAVIISGNHETDECNAWLRCIQSTNLSWIRSFAFVAFWHDKVVELDIRPHGRMQYHFKMRKIIRCGRVINPRRWATEEFDNDGFALVLGMPNLYTDEYIDAGSQLADRVQTIFDRKLATAGELKAAYDDAEDSRSLGRNFFSRIGFRSRTGCCFRENGNWLRASLSPASEL